MLSQLNKDYYFLTGLANRPRSIMIILNLSTVKQIYDDSDYRLLTKSANIT